jgi:hypothetical protein
MLADQCSDQLVCKGQRPKINKRTHPLQSIYVYGIINTVTFKPIYGRNLLRKSGLFFLIIGFVLLLAEKSCRNSAKKPKISNNWCWVVHFCDFCLSNFINQTENCSYGATACHDLVLHCSKPDAIWAISANIWGFFVLFHLVLLFFFWENVNNEIEGWGWIPIIIALSNFKIQILTTFESLISRSSTYNIFSSIDSVFVN